MFVSREEITERTGRTVDQQTLQIAQLMVEAWVGKDEAEVNDAGDFAVLGRAVMFQALYLGDSPDLILEQAAVKSIVANESTTVFDTSMFAPYMSPWAIQACKRLSWTGSRSVATGPWNNVPAPVKSWVTD